MNLTSWLPDSAAMHRARRVAGLAWVLIGVAFQGFALGRGVVPGPVTLVISTGVVLLALAVIAKRFVRSAGWVVAVLLGLDLAGAVADRFGALGGPGTAGVSWGDWATFEAYTATLLPGIPGLAGAAAVTATVVEVLLAVLLCSGRQRRWVGKATAGLFTVYLIAMGVALGGDAVARYALPCLIGGALLLSTVPRRRS